jgi:hypothetical protein
MVFSTVDETRTAITDSRHIRTAALAHRITYYTTMAGIEAATEAMQHEADLSVMSLQELHAELNKTSTLIPPLPERWPVRRRSTKRRFPFRVRT